jgi:excisionase family DNA binding protein
LRLSAAIAAPCRISRARPCAASPAFAVLQPSPSALPGSRLLHITTTGGTFPSDVLWLIPLCVDTRLPADHAGGLMDQMLLRPEEVAECLNIGRSKVYELMRAGATESVRIGTCRRVSRTALERYVESLRPEMATS